jgi:hypothetical protein
MFPKFPIVLVFLVLWYFFSAPSVPFHAWLRLPLLSTKLGAHPHQRTLSDGYDAPPLVYCDSKVVSYIPNR